MHRRYEKFKTLPVANLSSESHYRSLIDQRLFYGVMIHVVSENIVFPFDYSFRAFISNCSLVIPKL